MRPPPSAADVRAAQARGDAQGALTLALSAWHQTKHPAVADAIDELSAQALERFSAPKAKDKRAFHRAWLDVAKERDDVATGWLAQTLTERLEVAQDHFGILRPDYTQTKYAAYFERLAALEGRVADPRVAQVLCALLEEPRFLVWDAARTRPLYAPLASLLVSQGDVRVIERLEALRKTPRATKALLREVIGELLEPLMTALGRVTVSSLPDESEWRRLAPARASVGPTAPQAEAERLEAIYASPSADGLRSVYADALLERGEVRGEFISLQLLKAPTAAQAKRAQALLKAHRAQWLGPLAPVLKATTFERGFLHSAELAPNSVATPEGWATAATDHRLATVAELTQGHGNADHLVQFLRGGALRNLKKCVLPTFRAIDVLGRPPLSRSVEVLELPARGPAKFLKTLGAMPLDALHTLRLSFESTHAAEWRRALEASTLLGRVKHLEVRARHWRDQDFFATAFAEWWSLPVSTFSMLGPLMPQPFVKLERRPSAGDSKLLRLWVSRFNEGTFRKLARHLPKKDTEVIVFGEEVTLADLR